jgi:hypothetical protein
MAARPGDLDGRQPEGPRLGNQGPDQGYALSLAERLRPRVRVQEGERVDDAMAGCLGLGLRRASLFGRAPVIHDLTLAHTIWGFLDERPPADLVELRRPLFEGVADGPHRYVAAREIVDLVPEATLRLSHADVALRFREGWRELLGQ